MRLNGKPINIKNLKALAELKGFELEGDRVMSDGKKVPLEPFLKENAGGFLSWLTEEEGVSRINMAARIEEKRLSGAYRI